MYFRSLKFTDSLSIGPTLIVGAPNYAELGSAQRGMVFLANSTMFVEGQYNMECGMDPSMARCGIDLGAVSYQELKGSKRMTKFGWDVAVVDLNKDGVSDLAISAPSTGLF